MESCPREADSPSALPAVLGIVVGYPALRLRGIYLALATIAFVQVVNVAVLNMPIAGGAVGIFGIPQAFASRLDYIWFFGPLFLLTMFVVHRITTTGRGLAFFAVREDELAAG